MDKLGLNGPWLLSQLVNFILLLVILRLVLYKPVLNMLHTRQQKIKESLEQAEQMRKQVAHSQEEYQRQIELARKEGQQIIAQATQAAERVRAEILADAQKEANQIIAKARESIELEQKAALRDLREEVASLAMLAAQRVIGQSLDEKAHRRLIQDFLNETGKFN